MDSGVAQESILGSPLFNIDQIVSPQISSCRIKFADDNTIYKYCSKEDLESALADIMNYVKKWQYIFENSGLKLNYCKTKFMVVRSNDNVKILCVINLTDEITIEKISNIKFLGITVDDKFTFKEHHLNLVDKLT